MEEKPFRYLQFELLPLFVHLSLSILICIISLIFHTHTQIRLCFSFVMMKSNIPFSRFIAQQPQLPSHLPKCANCGIIGSAKMDQTITNWQSNEINRIPSSRRHSCPSVLDSLVNFPDLIATCSGIDLSRVFLGQFLQNTIRFERERVYKRKF